jgi:hypothetical protein
MTVDPNDLTKREDPPSGLIFLDVDGVLNSGDGNNAIGQLILDGFLPIHQDQRWFQPRHVRLLNAIELQSGASLVLSSSWRLSHHEGAVEALMREAGYRGGGFVGSTDSAGPTRGAEILRTLKHFRDNVNFEPIPYVVLDDDWDKDLDPDHFVQTDYQEGLAERHVERALKILGAP